MASGKYAVAISDRSGFKFRWKDMIKEPGTGFIVHPSESDGPFNLKDHPQNNLGNTRAENIGLAWTRPDSETPI
jgi:hypothetical protein